MAHSDCPIALESSASGCPSDGGFHHHSAGVSSSSSDDENDDCFVKNGSSSSLEDTLSLTCDESLTSSSMSSSTSIGDDNDDSDDASSSDEDDNSNNIYQSPHLLRRRLLPLAPSPIIPTPQSDLVVNTNNANGPLHLLPYYKSNNNSSPAPSSPLWKKHLRPSGRILWFTLALAWIVHQLSFSAFVIADYRWMMIMGEINGVVDGTGGGGGGVEPMQPPTLPFNDAPPLIDNKETQEWKAFFNRKAPKILHKLPTRSSSKQYTIRIRGNRVDLIKQSLDFHSNCPSVKEVQVEWTSTSTANGIDLDRDPQQGKQQNEKSRLPHFLLGHKSGKVKPIGRTSTSAVFLLDEDLILSCQEIERAFREWRLDPSRLVGFYPFHHTSSSSVSAASTFSATKKQEGARVSSDFQLRPVSRGGSYSMVSDRAVFIHSHYLRSIPFMAPKRECQQLGVSIIVSSMTSKPPVVVMSNPKTLRQSTNKRKSKISKHVSSTCRRWIESIAAADLPDQLATVVGLSHHQSVKNSY